MSPKMDARQHDTTPTFPTKEQLAGGQVDKGKSEMSEEEYSGSLYRPDQLWPETGG
jgi:hypothetical protein